MREPLDEKKLQRFLEELGRAVKGSGKVYLTGGATAVAYGWRARTIDVDLRLDPEPPGAFEAIARLKDELDVNVELASPMDFLPEVPGWRERSVFAAQHGPIAVYHYDPVSQVLAKLARGYERDLSDARSLLEARLSTKPAVAEGFEAIREHLVRFPRLDSGAFAARVRAFIGDDA